MKGLWTLCLAVACIALDGCAGLRAPPPTPVPIIIRENFALRQFELELRNETADVLCVNYGDWPRHSGEIPHPLNKVYLEQDGQTYPMTVELMSHKTHGELFDGLAPSMKMVGAVPFSLFTAPGLDQPNPSRRLVIKNMPILPCRLKPSADLMGFGIVLPLDAPFPRKN